jgi:PHD/YefM family antitoxin component YafN of YafNO toxin-antitoxin module
MLEEMQKPQKTISMAKFAKNPESVARDIDASGAVYSIQRPGKPRMLMMDAEYYDGWRIVIELMQNPNWREELEQSRRDIEAGRGISLDELEAELGLDRPVHSRRRRSAARASRAGSSKSTGRAPRPGRRTQ